MSVACVLLFWLCVGADRLRSACTTYENELKPKRALHASKSVTSTSTALSLPLPAPAATSTPTHVEQHTRLCVLLVLPSLRVASIASSLLAKCRLRVSLAECCECCCLCCRLLRHLCAKTRWQHSYCDSYFTHACTELCSRSNCRGNASSTNACCLAHTRSCRRLLSRSSLESCTRTLFILYV